MAELTDNLELRRALGLAAGADEFSKGNREPGLSVEALKLELRSGQFDRHRAIMSRVHEALFAGQIRSSEAIDYLTRIRRIGEREFGSDLATEWFGREPDLPGRREFERMIEDYEQRTTEGQLGRIVTGLGRWPEYAVQDGRMTGVLANEDKRILQVERALRPIIYGSIPLEHVFSRDHEREYQIFADMQTTMHFDGRHIFGTVRGSLVGQRSQPILPYVDGVLIDRIDGKEIREGRIVGVTERGWTGTCRVAGDDLRTLPVVDGHIIDQMEGRTINYTSLVGPTPTGRLNGLVNLSDVEMRRVVVEGRILKIEEQEAFIPTGTSNDRPHILFHHGTVSGTVCLKELGVTKSIMLAFGKPVNQVEVAYFDGEKHPQVPIGLEQPHLDRGMLCGRVRIRQDYSLPMIDGVVESRLQGRVISDVLDMEVINGNITGIFWSRMNSEYFFMIDGRVIEQVDGRRIEYGQHATCHNVAGTFNGMAYFEDERDPNGRLGPIHKFVLGKRVK